VIAALVLWSHALAALAFALIGLDQANRTRGNWPKTALVTALAMTSLWALTAAGTEAHDIANPIAVALRDLAWFAVMGSLVRRHRSSGLAIASVYAVAIGMTVASAVLALVATTPVSRQGAEALASAGFACRMMEAVVALVLVHHVDGAIRREARWIARPVVIVLGAMFGWDLVSAGAGALGGMVPPQLSVVRGFLMTGAALLFAVAVRDQGEAQMSVSRSAVMRALSIVALIGYAAVTILLTDLAHRVAPEYVRIAQTAIVLGSATALVTLLSTPWLRAWTRVKLSKHLFRHRYDYRVEWQRFTTTLGMPGPMADPLDRRIVKAIADMVASPAGLLLTPHADGLEAATGWHWDGAGQGMGEGMGQVGGDGARALAAHLELTSRIVDVDLVRSGRADPAEAAIVPDWIIARSDAWILVPLIHHATLVGAILLARPPVERALDWEDLDLLRIAGRQAASYLAEDSAHSALADVQRFDEFNRRFAFIVHDIKNLVSGLTLVARNAQRHADNPDFRADMVATLQDSVVRMNALLARLSQHHQPSVEPVQAVDVGLLVRQLALAKRAQGKVAATGDGIAAAQPGKLDQLLAHLVQNAIEASDAADVVAIRVADDDGRVVIEIADRGCGMSTAFVRDQLFRPFASSKPGGFGIGAYEARLLAEAMGGAIAVDSREGEGTCFRVSLPLASTLTVAPATSLLPAMEAAA